MKLIRLRENPRLRAALSIASLFIFAFVAFSITHVVASIVKQRAMRDATDNFDFDSLFPGIRNIALESDLKARMKFDTPVNALKPFPAEVGVVVCNPIAPKESEDLSSGIGGWLNVMVAGRPDFGRSTTRSNVNRAMREIGRPNGELTRADAAALARALGVTHVVYGVLSGSSPSYSVRYNVYSVDAVKSVPATFIATGSGAQIVASLPKLAAKMISALGGKAAPMSMPLSIDDLQFLGGIDLYGNAYTMSMADRTRLADLAPKSPYAGIVDLEFACEVSEYGARAAVRSLMSQAPENSIVMSSIADCDRNALVPYTDPIRAAFVTYPHNYNHAYTAAVLARTIIDPHLDRKAGEVGAQASPANPDAWINLGLSIYGETDAARKARAFGAMDPFEQEFIARLYPDWVACEKRAVALDPHFGNAWLSLAKAAQFNGNDDLASTAFWNAYRCSPQSLDVYSWGLQMFQPKWRADTSPLEKVASLAANATYDNGSDVTSIADDLTDAGYDQDAKQLVSKSIAVLGDTLQKSPDNGYAHWQLAILYKYNNDSVNERKEISAAEQFLPGLGDVHYWSGSSYEVSNATPDQLKQAIAEYRKALAIDPDSPSLYAIGYDLNFLGQLNEAEQYLKRCVAVYPLKADAWFALGEVYEGQKRIDLAEQAYRHTLGISPFHEQTGQRLIVLLDETGKYNEALKYAQLILSCYPQDTTVLDDTADIYLNMHKWALSETASRYSIELQDSDAIAHENFGEALVHEGDHAGALKEWTRVLQMGDPRAAAAARQMLRKYP